MGDPLKLPFELLQLFIANALPVDKPSFQSFLRSKGQLKAEADLGMLKMCITSTAHFRKGVGCLQASEQVAVWLASIQRKGSWSPEVAASPVQGASTPTCRNHVSP